MGRISLNVYDKIEEMFRQTVHEQIKPSEGYRGAMTKALNEALYMWVQSYRRGKQLG